MSSVEQRLRRLEDAEVIRTPDATCYRLLDDGWPALVVPSTGYRAPLPGERGRHRSALEPAGRAATPGGRAA